MKLFSRLGIERPSFRSAWGLLDAFGNSGLTFAAGVIVANELSVSSSADFFLLLNWSLIAIGLVKAFFTVPLRNWIVLDLPLGVIPLALSAAAALFVALPLSSLSIMHNYSLVWTCVLVFVLTAKETIRTNLLMRGREFVSATLLFVGGGALAALQVGNIYFDGFASPELMIAAVIFCLSMPQIIIELPRVFTRFTFPSRSDATAAAQSGGWIGATSLIYSATEMMLPTLIGLTLGSDHLVFYATMLTLANAFSPAYRYLFIRGLTSRRVPTAAAIVWSTVGYMPVLISSYYLYDVIYDDAVNMGFLSMLVIVYSVCIFNSNTVFDAYLNRNNLQKKLFKNMLVSIMLASPLIVGGILMHSDILLFSYPLLRALVNLYLNVKQARHFTANPRAFSRLSN